MKFPPPPDAQQITNGLRYFFVDFLFKGCILFPWYCQKCCWSGCEMNEICLPGKRYCSVNGKNKGTLFQIPYIEVLCVLWGLLALGKQPLLLSMPFGYIDRQDLLAENVTFDASRYRDFLGNLDMYERELAGINYGQWESDPGNPNAETKRHVFTMLDRQNLLAWNPQTYVTQNEINARFPEYKGKPEDFITMSANCICIGVMDYDSNYMTGPLIDCQQSKLYQDKVALANASITTPTYYSVPSCRNTTSLLNYQDLYTYEIRQMVSAYDGCGQAIQMGLILSMIRLAAYAFCRVELIKPGSQWICGFWAFIAFMRAMSECDAVLTGLYNLDPVTGVSTPYRYWNQWMMMPAHGTYAEMAYIIYPYSTSVDATFNPLILTASLKSLCMWAGILNFACLWVSTEAYCTDCTTTSYSVTHHARLAKSRERSRIKHV